MATGSVRLDGVVVLLSRGLARRLYERVLAPARADVRDDPEVYEFVRNVYEFGFADVPLPRTSADLAATLRETMTPAQAAGRLGIGAGEVRKAIRAGRLPAAVDALGHYSISGTAFDDYRASRRAQR